MIAKVVMNKKTGDLAEMTHCWMGFVIWLVEYDGIPINALAIYPYVLYDDDVRFKQWKVIGDL